MTREELFRAMGEVREDQIADAAEKPNRTAPRWRRYGALAACLAVVLAGAFGMSRLGIGGISDQEIAQESAQESAGESGLDETDGPLAPRYSVGAEIREIDGSDGTWAGPFNSAAADSSLVWLDPEEILALDTVIFRGTVMGMRYFEVTVGGLEETYTVASVEVSDCLRGDLAAGDTYNVAYRGGPGVTTSLSGDLENLEVGSEAIFMPYVATPETGWGSGDSYFCYADLAELYMDEGRRFLFLDTGDGVSYASEVYDIPASNGESVTLDDVAAYLRGLLGMETGTDGAQAEQGS